jgi:ATP-dependent RNA helicase RhlE
LLEAFKNKEVGVLVATDIAARGIDIDQLPLLSTLIYQIFQTYVHRIGRTGRAGNGGVAISFVAKMSMRIGRYSESN